MIVPCCVEVALIIPDNEAATALSTLQRHGLPVGALERADLYRFAVDAGRQAGLEATLRSVETIYNPNKHALRVRGDLEPGPGELWIAEIPHGSPGETSGAAVRFAGRTIEGVHGVERFVSWRLFDDKGAPAEAETVRRAAQDLLWNPAFQTATML